MGKDEPGRGTSQTDHETPELHAMTRRASHERFKAVGRFLLPALVLLANCRTVFPEWSNDRPRREGTRTWLVDAAFGNRQIHRASEVDAKADLAPGAVHGEGQVWRGAVELGLRDATVFRDRHAMRGVAG